MSPEDRSEEFQDRRNEAFAQACDKAAGISGLLLGLVIGLGMALLKQDGGWCLKVALIDFTVCLLLSVPFHLGRVSVYAEIFARIERREHNIFGKPPWWYVPSALGSLIAFALGCVFLVIYLFRYV